MSTAVRVSPRKLQHDGMVLRIVTRCTSEDELVTAFRELCNERTLFIPGAQARATGIETGFSVQLVDNTPVLRGVCVVLASWTTADNPYGRPGVRLGLRSLTPASQPVHDRILRARAAPVEIDDGDTVRTGPPRQTATGATPRPPDARTPGSTIVVPANPLSEISDESLCSLVEAGMTETTRD